jgi:hypothetical protein
MPGSVPAAEVEDVHLLAVCLGLVKRFLQAREVGERALVAEQSVALTDPGITHATDPLLLYFTSGTTATSGCIEGGVLRSISNLVECGAGLTYNGTAFGVSGDMTVTASGVGMTNKFIGYGAAPTLYNVRFFNELAGTNATGISLGSDTNTIAGHLYQNPVGTKTVLSYGRTANAAGTVVGGDLSLSATEFSLAFSGGASLATVFTISSGGVTTIGGTGSTFTSGTPLTVNNGSSLGDIAKFQSAGSDLVTITDAGQTLHASGTRALPGISFLGDTSTGFYRAGTYNPCLVAADAAAWCLDGTAVSYAFSVKSTAAIGFASGAAESTSIDTYMQREAAGIFKFPQRALTAATMTAETTGSLRDFSHSYTWSNAQVVALGAALTGNITVATLPAKTQVLDAMVVITGAGAGTTTLTVSCGDAIAGTPFINYVVASDAKAAANTVYGDAVAERGTSIDTEFWYLPSYTATTLVTCQFISTGANLDQVTGSTGRVILTTRLLP